MYPLPFVVLLMDCPASLDLAAYFNSAAGTLIGVNFPWERRGHLAKSTAPGNGAGSIPPQGIIGVAGKPNFQACLACHTSAYSLPWAKMSQILHATTPWSPGATEARPYGCGKSRGGRARSRSGITVTVLGWKASPRFWARKH
jgi:hypothetical protein